MESLRELERRLTKLEEIKALDFVTLTLESGERARLHLPDPLEMLQAAALNKDHPLKETIMQAVFTGSEDDKLAALARSLWASDADVSGDVVVS